MAMLTREQIKGARLKSRVVSVPEWGGDVTIRELTLADRARVESAFQAAQGGGFDGLRELVVALGLVDETGAAMFSESEAAALGEASGAAVNRLSEIVLELSGMTPGAAEALEKN